MSVEISSGLFGPEVVSLRPMRYLLLPLILLSIPAHAHDVPEVKSIYWSDGDSGWINGRKHGFAFRIADMDAPETYRSDCEAERVLGYEAKAFAVEATTGAKIEITGLIGHDRYERHVVTLSVDGRDIGKLGETLDHYRSWKHKNGRAVEKRPEWCE